MATQVVAVHEMPVTATAPVGNVDSLIHVLGPLAATPTGDHRGVERAGLVAHGGGQAGRGRGQVIVPTEVTTAGSTSDVADGVQAGLDAERRGVAVESEHTRRAAGARVAELAGGRRSGRRSS